MEEGDGMGRGGGKRRFGRGGEGMVGCGGERWVVVGGYAKGVWAIYGWR